MSHSYSRGDRAPVGNTCPDIDSIIAVLEGVADRLDEVAGKTEDTDAADEIETQAMNLRELFNGRRSALEELRSGNDQLRRWGNAETERADNAEEEAKALQRQIDELESI